MFSCCHVDFLKGDELRFYENVLVGNLTFDNQENEQACHQIG